MKKSKIPMRTLVLRSKKKSWLILIESLQKFTDDFMEEDRMQLPAQKRNREDSPVV